MGCSHLKQKRSLVETVPLLPSRREREDVEETTQRCAYQNSSSPENLPSDVMLIRDAERAVLWSAQQDAGPFREIRGGEEAFFSAAVLIFFS